MKIALPTALLVAASFACPALAHPGHGTPIADHDTPGESRFQQERVVTGWGAQAYASVPGWCQPPEGDHFGATHGSIAVDADGHVYVSLDSGTHGLAVYDSDGAFVRMMGEGFVGIHHLVYVEEDGTGYLYGAHLAGKRIFKMTLEGEVLWTLGCPMGSGKYTDPNQYNPTAVAVAPDGRVYVVDGYGQNWVHVYDRELNYQQSFGGHGSGDGQFATCHGIALDPRGETPTLLICDRENRRLQRFSLDGEFIAVTTTGLYRPCALSFHGEYVAVAELAGRVVILDANDQPVSVLGDNPVDSRRANFGVEPIDWEEAVFNAPHGLSFDREGNLLVMEWNRWGRVTYLTHVDEADAPAAPPVDKYAADPETYGQWLSRDAEVTVSTTSQWDPTGSRPLLVQANRPDFAPEYAFHTDQEVRPWVRIDLGEERDVRGVSVWNRPGVAEIVGRADGLKLLVSSDGEHWEPVWSEASLPALSEVDLPVGTRARYLVLVVDRDAPTYLHLKHVRVYGE
ncbi:MAG: discoidin domain-containing protein [Phycisphaerales bacterium JB063]